MGIPIYEIEAALETHMWRHGNRCIHVGMNVSSERTVRHSFYFTIKAESISAKRKDTELSANHR